MANWFDLKDPSGAKLKLASINDAPHLFVTGLPYLNPKTQACVSELGFNTVPSRRYLVRRAQAGEKLTLSFLRKVFPSAMLVDMQRADYVIEQSAPGNKAGTDPKIAVDLKGMKRLGRNAQGQAVYESPTGRFVLLDNGHRRDESPQMPKEVLRLSASGVPAPQGDELKDAVLELAGGFVKSMDAGEVQYSEDYLVWRDAVFADQYRRQPPNGLAAYQRTVDELMFAAVDAALIKSVRAKYDVAGDAYGPMARLYDYLPPYQGVARGLAAIPQPLSVAAQRLLGDTVGKTVLYPQAYDGASFAFLPEGTHIRACQSGRDFDVLRIDRPDVQWIGNYSPITETGADAMFFNMDPKPARDEYRVALQAIRSLAVGARAVLVLAGDDERSPGRLGNLSVRFLETLARNHTVDDVFETAPILSRKSGSTRGLRVFVLRNVASDEQSAVAQRQRLDNWFDRGVKVIPSWDGLKTHVDELIAAVDLREAQSTTAQIDRALANEGYQRPYVSFSKIGEARTMSPSNLQASAQAYLTRLEQTYGPVDEFVSRELGMGLHTLAQRFSPEQMDGIAVMLSRYMVDRSSILADDTGLGKGRELAAVATWANKHGLNVFFVTDKSNLFSDLARDLNDIGEWDRFRPLVLNADGEITVDDGPGGAPRILATGAKPADMAHILEQGLSLEQVQANIGFLSYSQISGKESPKAQWLKNQLANALVIFDEAHIAAGSDSNVALHVSQIAALAKHVQFSSATWAKTHDNLHIYQRALPASVSIGTLTETMRKGGDSFAEIFSTMLSAEGALIRREHDLSKLDVEMVIDEGNRARNEMVSDRVADVLGSAAYISGEMQQVFIRANSDSVKRLKAAREVRARAVSAKLFSASFGGGSVIYQVMKSVQGALNAQHVAELAVQSINRGFKPVIVTDATGESIVNQLVQEMQKERLEQALLVNPDAKLEEVNEIRTPTLRDMLRLIILRRLSMVKILMLTPDDVQTDAEEAAQQAGRQAPHEEEGEPVEPAEEVAGVVNPEVAPAVAPVPPVEAEIAIELDQAIQSTQGNDGEDDDVEPVAGVKRKKRIYQEISILELSDLPPEARDIYVAGLNELMEKINAVPEIDILGFDVMAQRLREHGVRVSEISGRKNMLIPVEGNPGMRRLVPRVTSKRAVKATIRGFNSGEIGAVIINKSAAAGVSMHASPRFADQSRRHMIEHQIPEDPVTRVQLLGRVNRFDQLSSPLITTASTGIYGEVRYLMMQNRKLARMSANVRSSRDNAMTLKGVTDLFNPVGKSSVKGFLLDNPLISRRLGISDFEVANSPELVNKLTMRIPLLTVAQQKMVYEDLYARFDEILMRAELDGENPLRPHELNVRASTESEVMFFGDDSTDAGMISAFDAPVMARRIKWVETLNPLKYDAVKEAANVSVERLLGSGYVVMQDKFNTVTQMTSQVPVVNPELVAKIVQAQHSLTRLAHMTTGESTYEASMVNHPAAARAYVKYEWFKRNLHLLVPGSKLSIHKIGVEGALTDWGATLITDVKPPESDSDLMDPGKWRITTVTTGDERARTYTLRSILTALDGKVSKGEITGDLNVTFEGPYFGPGIFGVSQETLRNLFEFMPTGRRVRTANMLTGNMYLAAEWSAAVGKGTSINYTDDSGRRHRVIQLPAEMDRIDPQHLPVRVADSLTLEKLILPLVTSMVDDAVEDDDGGTHVFDTTFKSAMASLSATTERKRDSLMVITSGRIAVSCAPKDARRMRAALSSGQKSIRIEELGPTSKNSTDPNHVEIRMHSSKKELAKLPVAIAKAMSLVRISRVNDLLGTVRNIAAGDDAKESKASVLVLSIKNEDQAKRAVSLIRNFTGLEVYATTREHKSLARAAIRDVLAQRRQEMTQMQAAIRAGIEQAASVADIEPIETQESNPGELLHTNMDIDPENADNCSTPK